jgi:hypothetical protein
MYHKTKKMNNQSNQNKTKHNTSNCYVKAVYLRKNSESIVWKERWSKGDHEKRGTSWLADYLLYTHNGKKKKKGQKESKKVMGKRC